MKIIQLAIRTLLRFKLYTGINMLGLALSLACTIIISRYVYQELTANQFIKDLDRVYLSASLASDNRYRVDGTGRLDGGYDKTDPAQTPVIEKSTTFYVVMDDHILSGTEKFNASVFAVDTNFLDILSFPLIQGTKENVLSDPQSAVITRSFAKKIFGSEDPVGKQLAHSSGQFVTITGIIGEPATKSSIRFDLLVSSAMPVHWMWMPYTFLKLFPGADIARLNPKETPNDNLKTPGREKQQKFFPFKEFYFNRNIYFFDMPDVQGNYDHVIILLIVAGLVLATGVFNFVNIYTVLMLKRAREFGMKKVFGGNPGKIIGQLLAENTVLVGSALIGGWALVEITKGLVSKELGIPQLSHPGFDSMLSAGMLLALPVITSIYPFIRYNYAPPVVSLRSVTTGGNSIVSRILFLFMQYLITFTLIVLALFFVKQLYFMLNNDLGYRTENIVKVQFHRMENAMPSADTWKQKMEKREREVEEIKQRINASPLFTGWYYGSSPNELMEPCLKLKVPGGEFKETAYSYLSEQAFNMYGFEIVQGRGWDDTIDTYQDYTFIVNETAWKLFGFTSLDQASLQPEFRLWSNPDTDSRQNPPYRIIGVIKDFKGSHLSKATAPLVLSYDKGSTDSKLIAGIAKGKKAEAIAFLKKLHDDTVGGEFAYSFLADEVQNMYREDRKVATIYSVFALTAILISSLGLFGISLFDVRQRYREIALRKVNGATANNILALLLQKYYKLLAFSFGIAMLISYIAIQKYLEDFAYKTPVSWWIFVLAAAITTCVSLGTLVFHMRKAANSNPAVILKSE